MTRILLALLLVGCKFKPECPPAGTIISLGELRECRCPIGTEPVLFSDTWLNGQFYRCVPGALPKEK